MAFPVPSIHEMNLRIAGDCGFDEEDCHAIAKSIGLRLLYPETNTTSHSGLIYRASDFSWNFPEGLLIYENVRTVEVCITGDEMFKKQNGLDLSVHLAGDMVFGDVRCHLARKLPILIRYDRALKNASSHITKEGWFSIWGNPRSPLKGEGYKMQVGVSYECLAELSFLDLAPKLAIGDEHYTDLQGFFDYVIDNFLQDEPVKKNLCECILEKWGLVDPKEKEQFFAYFTRL